jgi:hypothetical protein
MVYHYREIVKGRAENESLWAEEEINNMLENLKIISPLDKSFSAMLLFGIPFN